MIAPLVLAALAAAAATPGNLCTLCHPAVRVEFNRSIHNSEDVACVSCHGGNPASSDVKTAHGGNFRGKIARRDVPALCASCHANPVKMLPYKLPTDQFALYQTSAHGRALAKGDDKVAVCTDCHGVHEILPPDDPQSSVHPVNIPKTCARCHANRELMAKYGLTDDPYADFKAGVHGQALLERRDNSAPGCAQCHGAHGAAPPGIGDINKICGQCHPTARAHFLEGPHKAAMDAAGLPECASCHSNHKIEKTSIKMLDTVCLECHDKGSDEVELAAKMKTLYVASSNDLDRAGALLDKAAQIPLYVADYQARLQEARTSLTESLPAMHAVNLTEVEELTGRARSIGHEVESEIQRKFEARGWRKVGLAVFWFYLVVTVGALLRYRRRAALEAES